MKRKDGYYWVRMRKEHGLCWVCALYRQINTLGIWLMPGLQERFSDDLFDFISADPIPAPNQPNTIIWTP